MVVGELLKVAHNTDGNLSVGAASLWEGDQALGADVAAAVTH
jgi:hypothetical protein